MLSPNLAGGQKNNSAGFHPNHLFLLLPWPSLSGWLFKPETSGNMEVRIYHLTQGKRLSLLNLAPRLRLRQHAVLKVLSLVICRHLGWIRGHPLPLSWHLTKLSTLGSIPPKLLGLYRNNSPRNANASLESHRNLIRQSWCTLSITDPRFRSSNGTQSVHTIQYKNKKVNLTQRSTLKRLLSGRFNKPGGQSFTFCFKTLFGLNGFIKCPGWHMKKFFSGRGNISFD